MNKKTSLRLPSSSSDNPKSAIPNPKWAGLFAIIVALAMCGARAEAQQQAKIPKIGWLGIRAASSDPARESFRREFRALGYVDGMNIVFEYRSADDKIER